MIEPKACPFCGKTDCLGWTDETTYYKLRGRYGSACVRLYCNRCKVDIYEHNIAIANYDDKLDALIKKWNDRKISAFLSGEEQNDD